MTDLDPVRRAALIERYRAGHAAVVEALAGITDAELDARPAGEGEWTAREVVHHVADSEMTSAIRLRRLIAEDQPVIVGYDGDEFARKLHYADRPIGPSLDAARGRPRDDRRHPRPPHRGRVGSARAPTRESGPYGVGQWLEIYAAHAHDHAAQIRRGTRSRRLARRRRLTPPLARPQNPRPLLMTNTHTLRAPAQPHHTRRSGRDRASARPVTPSSPGAPVAAHGRDRPRGRPRHAHEVGDAQGPAPGVRAADDRVRARRRVRRDRHATRRRLLAGHRGGPRRRRGARRRRRSRTSPAAPATRCAAALDGAPRRRRGGPRPLGRRAAGPGGPAVRAARAARPRPRGDRPRLGRRARSRPASAGSCATTAGTVERIVEDKDATDEERQISEINAGLYAIDAAWLRRRIGDLRPSPATGRAVPHRPRRVRARGRAHRRRARHRRRRAPHRDQRPVPARPRRVGHAGRAQRPLDAGRASRCSTPRRSTSTTPCELAQDVVLEPNVILRGATSVGERTRIATGSQVFDSPIGADCVVWASVVERSVVEDHVTIGPFSHLRPGTHVGRPLGDRQLRRAQEQHASASTCASTTTATWATPTSAPTPTSARARSPPTTTARRSTARRSARACSWASTRCSGAPVTAGRRVEDRRRGRRHAGRAAGQARGGRAGADPRAARRATDDAATRPMGPARRPSTRRPAPTAGDGTG